MEVAHLTAVLEAEVARFQANMKAADAALDRAEKHLNSTDAAAVALSKSLNEIEVSNSKLTASISGLKRLQDALNDVSRAEASGAVAAKADAAAIGDIGSEAVKSAIEVRTLSAAMKDFNRNVSYPTRGPGGKFLSGAEMNRAAQTMFLTGNNTPGDYIIPPGYKTPGWPGNLTDSRRLKMWEELAARDMGLSVARSVDRIIGPLTKADYQLELAARGFKNAGLSYGGGDLPPNPIYRNIEGFGKGDVSGAMRYLKRRGINWDEKFDRPSMSVLDALGWGGGSNGRGGGRGGRFLGMPGWAGYWANLLTGGPHARFGSALGLAGFGAERMLFSGLGIMGSLGGAALGGGLLGMGALGTFGVGAGTNLAGVAQAIGDTSKVSKDLEALNEAIARYGKKSSQAITAQSQLNYDLGEFSGVARNAVIAAAQTSDAFHKMWKSVTGPAEKTGAEIINQAMHVGMKFLPTIGRFARQNMNILQKGLQPLFGFMSSSGSPQPALHAVERYRAAVQKFGANSDQAAAAKQAVNAANRRTGGLGIFTDLEKIFQKNFPVAVHAGVQGFELLMKTVDLAAQHIGGFIRKLDSFLTKMNGKNFAEWARGVEGLIDLFHSWAGMFVSLGKLIFTVMKPAVGLGKAVADGLNNTFKALNKYFKQPGTQSILHSLFSAHLYQLITGFGGLFKSLLPLVEQFLSAFMQIEAGVSMAFAKVLVVITKVTNAFNWLDKKTGGMASKIAGWSLALGLVFFANDKLLRGLGKVMGRIPIIGRLFTIAAEAAAAGWKKAATVIAATVWGLIKSAFAPLIAWIKGIGTTATVSAVEAEAALASIDAAAAETVTVLGVVAEGEIQIGAAAGVMEAEATGAFAAIAASAASAIAVVAGLISILAAIPFFVAGDQGGRGRKFDRSQLPEGATNVYRTPYGSDVLYTLNGKHYEYSPSTGRSQLMSDSLYKDFLGRKGVSKIDGGPGGSLSGPTGATANKEQYAKMGAEGMQKKIQAKLNRELKNIHKLFGTPAGLPSGVPSTAGGGGGGGGGGGATNRQLSALESAAAKYAKIMTGLPAVKEMTIKQAKIAERAADQYLKVLHQQLKQIEATHKTGKDRVQQLKQERYITEKINSITKDRIADEKQVNSILKARKELKILGVGGSANQPHLNLKNQMKKITSQISMFPDVVTPDIQKKINAINKVIKMGIANSTVRTAVQNAIQQLSQVVEKGFSLMEKRLGDVVNNLMTSIQQIGAAADSIFQRQTDLVSQGMDSASAQIYQQNRDVQQQAMDQQIQQYEQLMQEYPAKTTEYLQAIQDVYKKFGVNVSGQSMAVGGQIYNGMPSAFDAVTAQMKNVQQMYMKIALMKGGIGILEQLGFTPKEAYALKQQAKSGTAQTSTPYAAPHVTAEIHETVHLRNEINVHLDGKKIATEVRDQLIRMGKRNRTILSGKYGTNGTVNP